MTYYHYYHPGSDLEEMLSLVLMTEVFLEKRYVILVNVWFHDVGVYELMLFLQIEFMVVCREVQVGVLVAFSWSSNAKAKEDQKTNGCD